MLTILMSIAFFILPSLIPFGIGFAIGYNVGKANASEQDSGS